MADPQSERKDDGAAAATTDAATTAQSASAAKAKAGDGMLAWAGSVSEPALQRKIQHRAQQRRVADAKGAKKDDEDDQVEEEEEPPEPRGWNWTSPARMTDGQRAAADAARWAINARFGS